MEENSTRNLTSLFARVSNPKLDIEALTGLILLYSLTTLLSIIGNIFVIIVFKNGNRSRTDLRPFLINLAIADLMMALFCMPFTFADAVFGTWIFLKELCPVVLFVQMMSVAASVFTNMAIGIDRFLVVMYPLHHRFTLQRYKYVMIAIWVSSVSFGSVQLIVARTTTMNSGLLKCDEVWSSPYSRKVYTIFILLFTYIIPLVILAVTYTIVAFLLWKRTSPGNKDRYRDYLQWRSKIKVKQITFIRLSPLLTLWQLWPRYAKQTKDGQTSL